jgi:hypothetical protein
MTLHYVVSISWTFKNQLTRNPFSICMQSSPMINTYDTEGDVVGHTSDHLSERFCLAYSAPCYYRQLFDDLRFMGDTDCAQQILKGTCDYPPDTNIWTKKILKEAHYTFSQMSGTEIATTIMTPRTSKNSGNGLMKRHHLLSEESPSCIARQRHPILCLWQCTLHI